MKNCVIESDNGIALHYDTSGTGTYVFDNNHLERNGSVDFVEADGTTYDTASAWNSAESEASNNISTGPPLFASTTLPVWPSSPPGDPPTLPRSINSFYQPGPGSPLIGAGLGSVNQATDWAGVPYRAGASTPNIGARAHKFRQKFPRFGINMEITPIEPEEDISPEETVSIWPMFLECDCETPIAVNDNWPLALECECVQAAR